MQLPAAHDCRGVQRHVRQGRQQHFVLSLLPALLSPVQLSALLSSHSLEPQACQTAGWNNRLAHNFAYWLLIPLKVSCCHFYSSHTHCLPHSYKRTGKVPSSTVHSSLFTNLKFLNRLVSSFMWGFWSIFFQVFGINNKIVL